MIGTRNRNGLPADPLHRATIAYDSREIVTAHEVLGCCEFSSGDNVRGGVAKGRESARRSVRLDDGISDRDPAMNSCFVSCIEFSRTILVRETLAYACFCNIPVRQVAVTIVTAPRFSLRRWMPVCLPCRGALALAFRFRPTVV